MQKRDRSDRESNRNTTSPRVQILHDVKSLCFGRAVEKGVKKPELTFRHAEMRLYCSVHMQSETKKRANQILGLIMGEIL